MGVARVAGNERPALPVTVCRCDPQIPVANVVKLGRKSNARRPLYQPVVVVVIGRGVLRHRRMEEPALPHVHPAKEHPGPLEVRVEHPVGSALRKALERLMKRSRTEQRQHHFLLEVRPAPPDAELLPHHRTGAVAAHQIVGRQHALPRSAVLRDGHPHTPFVLLEGVRHPPEVGPHGRNSGQPRAQHALGQVLGQPLVVLKEVRPHRLPARWRVPILAH